MRDKTEIQKEIQIHLKFIKELKEMIPLGLMLVIGWGFVIPVFSRRGPSLADEFGYKKCCDFLYIYITTYLFICLLFWYKK